MVTVDVETTAESLAKMLAGGVLGTVGGVAVGRVIENNIGFDEGSLRGAVVKLIVAIVIFAVGTTASVRFESETLTWASVSAPMFIIGTAAMEMVGANQSTAPTNVGPATRAVAREDSVRTRDGPRSEERMEKETNTWAADENDAATDGADEEYDGWG